MKSAIPDPAALWLSARTRRWHTNARLCDTHDPLGSHQWRVAMIVRTLLPDASPALLWAALTHDVGEYRTGDVPSPAKRGEGEAELAACRAIRGPDPVLTDRERAVLKLADRTDALLWATLHGVWEQEDWLSYRQGLIEQAGSLGMSMRLGDLLLRVRNAIYRGSLRRGETVAAMLAPRRDLEVFDGEAAFVSSRPVRQPGVLSRIAARLRHS